MLSIDLLSFTSAGTGTQSKTQRANRRFKGTDPEPHTVQTGNKCIAIRSISD